jgi:hypothetical protein
MSTAEAELIRPGIEAVGSVNRRRIYSDAERAATLATLSINRGNLTKTAKDTGVPMRTIIDWRDKNCGVNRKGFAELQAIANNELTNKLDDIALQCVDLLPRKLSRASVKDINSVLNTAIDKSQLLKGLPTSITANTQAIESLRDKLSEAIELARQQKALNTNDLQVQDSE